MVDLCCIALRSAERRRTWPTAEGVSNAASTMRYLDRDNRAVTAEQRQRGTSPGGCAPAAARGGRADGCSRYRHHAALSSPHIAFDLALGPSQRLLQRL